jgi:DNA repair protein RecO (recombination protein O)
MPLYNAEAINIRTRMFGEADKIIILFTKEHGKLQAIAKGARRPTSKFGGRLEIFTYNKMLLAQGKSLDIISQCETIESFYSLREEKEKLNAGFYIVKLIDIITEERQKNRELFNLLLDSLYGLQNAREAKKLIRSFEVKLCEIEGFLPTNDMLGKINKSLPEIVKKLKGEDLEDITDKEMELSGSFFRELISDHTGKDIRGKQEYI